MKNQIKIALISFALIGAQIGCEKDIDSPSSTNSKIKNENSKFKPIQMQDKSGGLSYDLINDYTDDLESSNSPTDEKWNLALLMIESAINHTEGTLEQVSTHSELLEFSSTVDITESGGELLVEGNDALGLYDDLVADLTTEINNSGLKAEHGSGVFVSAIDLYLDGNPSGPGNIAVYAQAMLKFDVEPEFPNCSADNDWKALDQLGKCSGGSNLDAAIRIESMLTRVSCSSSRANDYCIAYSLSHVTFATKDGFSSSNIWDGTASSNCITELAINNTWEPGAITEANNMAPASPRNSQIDYMMGKATNTSGVAHELTVSYARVWCPPIDPI